MAGVLGALILDHKVEGCEGGLEIETQFFGYGS
jgi:hypothetical protein